MNSDATVAANLFNTALGGVFGSRVLPVLIGLSSFGSVGSMFYTGSRIILEAARKGYLPYDRFFAKSHPKLQTPVNSLLLLFTISLIFLLAPPPGAVFEFVLAFAGYGDYFFSVMAVIGLLIMRRTHPDIKRPIKTSIGKVNYKHKNVKKNNKYTMYSCFHHFYHDVYLQFGLYICATYLFLCFVSLLA